MIEELGVAEVLIRPNTTGFAEEATAEVDAGLAGVKTKAAKAGEESGAGLRSGVKKGASGLEDDLATIGSNSGTRLRSGVTKESGKLAKDLEDDGKKAGDGLTKGVSAGLSKLGSVLSATGIPGVAGLTAGMAKAGAETERTSGKAAGFIGVLDRVGGIAAKGAAVGLVATAGAALDLGSKMQTAEVSIANAAGTSVSAADKIGKAFQNTDLAGEFSGEKMATAYASVAGQLKATEGKAQTTGQAVKFMAGATDLARAGQIELGAASADTAGVLQAFQLKVGESSKVADILYSTSRDTGVSIDSLAGSVEKLRGKLGDSAGSLSSMTGLLVDMRDRGIPAVTATRALSSGMSQLVKDSDNVSKSQGAVKVAFSELPASLQNIVRQFDAGKISASQYQNATSNLTSSQKTALDGYSKSVVALQAANTAQKNLGVTVFNSQGQFVGMGSIIQQLGPKFAGMTQQQQLAAATQIFGAQAARQMIAVIDAGPASYDKATASATKMGAAHDAAAAQAKTLAVEIQTVEAQAENIITEFGEVLVPIVQKVGAGFVVVTQDLMNHKTALLAVGVVVGGVLTAAIGVFTVNKMAAFGQSFVTAGNNLAGFVNKLKSSSATVQSETGAMAAKTETDAASMNTALEGTATTSATSATTISESGTTVGTALATEDTAVSTSTAGIRASFASTGTSSTGAATVIEGSQVKVDAAVAGEATAVTAADATIEADNTAAGLSFTALLGPIAAVVGALAVAQPEIQKLTGGDITKNGDQEIKPGLNSTAGLDAQQIKQGYTVNPKNGALIPPGLGGNVSPSQANVLSGGQLTSSGKLNLSANQLKFASGVASGTGINPAVVEAWLAAEQGSEKQNPAYDGLYNFLNIGITGGPNGRHGATDAIWKDPTTAGVASAKWIEGKTPNVAGWTRSTPIFPSNIGSLTPAQQIALIQNSQFAEGHEPALPSAYQEAIANGTPSLSPAAASQRSISGGAKSPYHFIPDPGTVQTGGNLPAITADLNKLAGIVHENIYGISGYRTPLQSSRLPGGSADDPHTKHEAEDIGVGNQTRASASVLTAKELASVGLVRPFYPADPNEINHVQLLPGGETVAGSGGAKVLPTTGTSTKTSSKDAEEIAIAKAKGEEQVAATKTGIAGQIAQQKAALDLEVASEKAGAAEGTTAQKQATAIEIVQQKAALAVLVSQEEAEGKKQTAAKTKEAAKQTSDQKAANSQLNTLLVAIHSNNLNKMQAAIANTNTTTMHKLETDLDNDHKKALTALSTNLEQTWTTINNKWSSVTLARQQDTNDTLITNSKVLNQDEAAVIKSEAEKQTAAVKAAAEKEVEAVQAANDKQVKAIQDMSALQTDAAKAAAQATQDATKVSLDQQAQAGLAGADAAAAAAQTAYDQVVQKTNAGIAAVQAALDADTVNGVGEVRLATDQAALTAAQNTQTTSQATAQAALDLANAAKTTADAATQAAAVPPAPDAASTTTTTTDGTTATTTTAPNAAPPVAPIFNLYFGGTALTGQQLMNDIAWSISTGALPIPAAT